MSLPEFHSALKYTQVRDYAYHSAHPLHYGVPEESKSGVSDESSDATEKPSGEPALLDQELNNAPENDEPPDHTNIHQKPDDIYRRAVALFDFEPENSNETRLVEGQIVWISYRHGQGWLVAENLQSGETGLVPEEYVQVLPDDESEWVDTEA